MSTKIYINMREEDPRLREDDEKRREDDERNCEYNAGIRAYSAESLMQRTERAKSSPARPQVAPSALKYQ